MICKIINFLLPDTKQVCISAAPPVEITCSDWEIDSEGVPINCELPEVNGLPWDVNNLGRLFLGEDSLKNFQIWTRIL